MRPGVHDSRSSLTTVSIAGKEVLEIIHLLAPHANDFARLILKIQPPFHHLPTNKLLRWDGRISNAGCPCETRQFRTSA